MPLPQTGAVASTAPSPPSLVPCCALELHPADGKDIARPPTDASAIHLDLLCIGRALE
jgi:hypothetical protein